MAAAGLTPARPEFREVAASVNTFVWLFSAVPIAATVLPFLRSGRSWIRVWDYPRSQLAVILVAAAGLQLWLLPRSPATWALLGATLASMAWQVWRIYPYTPLSRVQVLPFRHEDPEQAVGLLITNVLQSNRNASALLERIGQIDPDLVLALETDAWWQSQLAVLETPYPHVVYEPLDNTYGMLLFSRLKLTDVAVKYRVEPDIPSIDATLHLRSGVVVDLHCLHPRPPGIGQGVDERDAELLIVGRESARSRRPAIVCGDLNDVAWSQTTRLFQRISGMLDPRVGRGLYATFHANYWFARWPLDHVFHDASFMLRRLEVLASIGSDHFPIYVQLVHDPAALRKHEVPESEAGDQKEASERIAEGVESGQSGTARSMSPLAVRLC